MRRLIINADDFGLTSGINRAIVEAHTEGIVTSATLMANGPAFSEAVQAAQSAARLGVGCHIVLVDGAPILDKSQVSTLATNRGGRLRDGFGGMALAAITRRLAPEQIEAEATAQLRKLQAAGIAITHLDTHKHVHMFPQVLHPLLQAAAACGVKAVRNPFEPVRLNHFAGRPALWKRGSEVAILRGLARGFRQAVREAGLATPDGTLGIMFTGSWGERVLRYVIENLSDGTWELVCHPGYVDQDLLAIKTRLRQSRARELEILKSPASRKLLESNGIELVSYRGLA